ARAVEEDPFHPYTLGLLLSEPPADQRVPKLIAIRGQVPRASEVAGRCTFADRCEWAKEECRAGTPTLRALAADRFTACIRREEIAPEMRALRTTALQAAEAMPSLDAGVRPIVHATNVVKDFA